RHQVVPVEHLIPGELAESDVLRCHVGRSTVHAVLVVSIAAETKGQEFLYRKLVVPEQFPTACVNTFPVALVPAAVNPAPVHFTRPAVLVSVPGGEGKLPTLAPRKARFIE